MEAIKVVVASLHYEKMKSEGVDVSTAIFPLLKLLSLIIIGLILAHPRVQLVPRSTNKLLSKLVFALFLPCLIFTDLGPSITLKNFILWWFLPVNVVISTVIGCLLGYLVALLCQPPPEFFRFTVVTTGFGNTGNILLAIVGSVCHNPDNPFGSECKRSGVAYVSLSQWVSVILVYTFVYHMMEPPLEYYEIVEDEEDEIVELGHDDSNVSRPLLVEAEWPGMEANETEHCKTPFIARLFKSESNISERNIPDLESIDEERTKSIRCLAEPKVVRKIRVVAEKTPIQHILQPPTIASFLAILVGIIPQVKSAIYGENAPLAVVTDSLDIMAEATVPSVMLILGGMLAEGPKDSRLGMRTTVGIIVARLLVLPVAGIGVIYLADKWHLLANDDRLYRFVLLLQYTTPSAILLGAVASLRGYAVKEASALLFWQHVFALFSLSFYIIVYFNLLLPYV